MPAVGGSPPQPAPSHWAATIVLTALAVAIAALISAAPVNSAGIARDREASGAVDWEVIATP
jgi:hypothetical protein